MLDELTQALKGLSLGDVDADIHAKLAPILSNANIFGSDLYKAGIGEKIEALFVPRPAVSRRRKAGTEQV